MDNPNFNTILAKALEEQKRITNADLIRAMTDEEFSHFLFGIQCAPASRPKEWLGWLQQEAK